MRSAPVGERRLVTGYDKHLWDAREKRESRELRFHTIKISPPPKGILVVDALHVCCVAAGKAERFKIVENLFFAICHILWEIRLVGLKDRYRQ